jgi:hypothetical protein
MIRRVLAAITLVLLLGGCEDPVRTLSDGALRTATANGAAAELGGRGYRLLGRLRCSTPASTKQVVRVRCVGETTRRRRVVVDGVAYDADSAHPHQQFLIEVGGEPVVRKTCLGQGCRDHG